MWLKIHPYWFDCNAFRQVFFGISNVTINHLQQKQNLFPFQKIFFPLSPKLSFSCISATSSKYLTTFSQFFSFSSRVDGDTSFYILCAAIQMSRPKWFDWSDQTASLFLFANSQPAHKAIDVHHTSFPNSLQIHSSCLQHHFFQGRNHLRGCKSIPAAQFLRKLSVQFCGSV